MSNIGNIIAKNSKSIILCLFVVCVLLIYIANKNKNHITVNYNSEKIEGNTIVDNSIQNNENTTQDEEIINKKDNEITNETDNDTEEERPETGNLDFNK
jgi:hypothetical protein